MSFENKSVRGVVGQKGENLWFQYESIYQSNPSPKPMKKLRAGFHEMPIPRTSDIVSHDMTVNMEKGLIINCKKAPSNKKSENNQGPMELSI